jgi:hypothetical protein
LNIEYTEGGAKGESSSLSMVADTKLEDLVSEEAPVISIELEGWKILKTEKMVYLDLAGRLPHLNTWGEIHDR